MPSDTLLTPDEIQQENALHNKWTEEEQRVEDSTSKDTQNSAEPLPVEADHGVIYDHPLGAVISTLSVVAAVFLLTGFALPASSILTPQQKSQRTSRNAAFRFSVLTVCGIFFAYLIWTFTDGWWDWARLRRNSRHGLCRFARDVLG